MRAKRRNSMNPRAEVNVNIKFSSCSPLIHDAIFSGFFRSPEELSNSLVEFINELNEEQTNLIADEQQNLRDNDRKNN